MTLKEMAALAMAGYKKKDIDALIEKENAQDPADPADPADPDKTDPGDPDAENGPKEGAQDDPDPDDNGGNDEIKTELEKAREEIAALKAKLDKAQKDNVKKDVGGNDDSAAKRAERMAERARSMM